MTARNGRDHAVNPANRRCDLRGVALGANQAASAGRVGRLARAEAAVAAAPEGRAERAAAGPRHRSEARDPRRPHATMPRRLHSRQTASSGSCGATARHERDEVLAELGPARSGSRAARRRPPRGPRPDAPARGIRRTRAGGRPRPGTRRGPTSCACAWIPPAVAHAPIVTSRWVTARSRAISSACSGVLIEPSTNRTSYGPADDARSPRRTRRGRPGSAIASSSSSRSRSVSWQPSHEANFTTPIRGRFGTELGARGGRARIGIGASPSQAPAQTRRPESAIEKTGPSRQTKNGPR